MKKRIISVILLVSISMTLCVPAFAATPGDDNILPPWVEEGETWFPANGIMPLEDFGNCPKGHTGPSGYKYEGYTMGNVTAHYDDLALILVIGSMATKDPITISVAGALAAVLNWLHGKEDPHLKYFKYVYTKKGGAPFIHVIYCTDEPGYYRYITCETYYEI